MKNDLISRQDAIDAFWKLEIELRPSTMDAIWDMLKSLPSAEQEHLVKESGDLVKDLVNDCISRQSAIDVEGLDEQIRCEMCRNPMHTDRGCDGCCEYDEKLYEESWFNHILGGYTAFRLYQAFRKDL